MTQTRAVEIPAGAAAMSVTFSGDDPLVFCHVTGCRWHARAGGALEAALAWSKHLARRHRDIPEKGMTA